MLFLSGCGSTANDTASKSPRRPASSSDVPADPNVANCSDVQDTMLEVQRIFQSWDIDDKMFDAGIASQLREQATSLYSHEAKASGPAKQAIHDEAAALVDLSISMVAADVDAFGSASDRANRALAALRGTCNF
jgi:hypothetical protein